MTLSGVNLSSATNVYECGTSSNILYHSVKHLEFIMFCESLSKFRRELGELAAHEYWRPFLRKLISFRFKLAIAPISFCHPEVYELDLIEDLARHLKHCDQLYPNFTQPAQNLVAMVDNLIQSRENPLLEFLSNSSLYISKHSAVLLYGSGMIKATRSEFIAREGELVIKKPGLLKADMIIASHLRSTNIYNKLIIIGPSFLFPDYVFNAPRTHEIHIVQYDWSRSRWTEKPAFVRSLGDGDNSIKENETLDSKDKIKQRASSSQDLVDASELIPTLDWQELSRTYADRGQCEQNIDEVEARLFLLEGNKAVFMESDESSKILAIDLEEILGIEQEQTMQTKSILKKILVCDVEPGMFILLRTCGGGDYIESLADKILGEKAVHVREVQRFWKGLLREAVRDKGLFRTSIELLDLGSIRANEVNVRNWMSLKNIRPHDMNDFSAIMKLIRQEDKIQDCWIIATMIDRAHRKAGYHIRTLLLRQVVKADLLELERLGEMNFELPEADGGSLTAFRITDISPQETLVPVNRIGQLFTRFD